MEKGAGSAGTNEGHEAENFTVAEDFHNRGTSGIVRTKSSMNEFFSGYIHERVVKVLLRSATATMSPLLLDELPLLANKAALLLLASNIFRFDEDERRSLSLIVIVAATSITCEAEVAVPAPVSLFQSVIGKTKRTTWHRARLLVLRRLGQVDHPYVSHVQRNVNDIVRFHLTSPSSFSVVRAIWRCLDRFPWLADCLTSAALGDACEGVLARLPRVMHRFRAAFSATRYHIAVAVFVVATRTLFMKCSLRGRDAVEGGVIATAQEDTVMGQVLVAVTSTVVGSTNRAVRTTRRVYVELQDLLSSSQGCSRGGTACREWTNENLVEGATVPHEGTSEGSDIIGKVRSAPPVIDLRTLLRKVPASMLKRAIDLCLGHGRNRDSRHGVADDDWSMEQPSMLISAQRRRSNEVQTVQTTPYDPAMARGEVVEIDVTSLPPLSPSEMNEYVNQYQ